MFCVFWYIFSWYPFSRFREAHGVDQACTLWLVTGRPGPSKKLCTLSSRTVEEVMYIVKEYDSGQDGHLSSTGAILAVAARSRRLPSGDPQGTPTVHWRTLRSERTRPSFRLPDGKAGFRTGFARACKRTRRPCWRYYAPWSFRRSACIRRWRQRAARSSTDPSEASCLAWSP